MKEAHTGYRMLFIPPLPNSRVSQSVLFTYMGADYFGPLYIKTKTEVTFAVRFKTLSSFSSMRNIVEGVSDGCGLSDPKVTTGISLFFPHLNSVFWQTSL